MSKRRVIAEINLSAIENNIEALYKHMPIPKPILAVDKADGYGHGATEIGKRLDKSGYIFGFATATSEEAIELRKSGVKKPIMVLGYVFEEDYDYLIDNSIIFTLFDVDSAKKLSQHAKAKNTMALVHIKVDTGMSRIGVSADENGRKIVNDISKLDNISIKGIFTHFSKADEIDKSFSEKQYHLFDTFISNLKEDGITFECVHCANSGAILQLPDTHRDVVRAGIVMYGLWPSDDVITDKIRLEPALSLKSHVVYIKDIKAGTSVSYGGTFTAKKDMTIATIPVGYADGYPRSLSNKGYVLINGQKANIVGRICMDQMMVDITGLNVNVMDEVVLIGTSQNITITAEELGRLSGRFNYELVCDISPRVPRIYIN